jgi:hypothetical protein
MANLFPPKKKIAGGNKIDPGSVYLSVPRRLLDAAPVGHPEE